MGTSSDPESCEAVSLEQCNVIGSYWETMHLDLATDETDRLQIFFFITYINYNKFTNIYSSFSFNQNNTQITSADSSLIADNIVNQYLFA